MSSDADETIIDGLTADAAAKSPILEENIPEIDGLRCEQFLGQGAAGAVFLVRQDKLSRWCALKVLHPHLGKELGFRRRFNREGQILAQMDHPNIVRVHDVGVKDGMFYLLLEYVDGGDLQDHLQRSGGVLEPEEVRRILLEVLDALSYAHRQQIIHCDLKPMNLLRTKDGRIKISDFGIAAFLGTEKFVETQTATLVEADATQVDASLPASGKPQGTPDYMAPEIRSGSKPSIRSDFFALGVITYYLLTGQKPIGHFRPASRVHPGIHRRWDLFINQCLATDPAERYASAFKARQAIESIPAVKPKRNAVLLAAAVALGILMPLGVFIANNLKDDTPALGDKPVAQELGVARSGTEGDVTPPDQAGLIEVPALDGSADRAARGFLAGLPVSTEEAIVKALPQRDIAVEFWVHFDKIPLKRTRFRSDESFGWGLRADVDAFFIILLHLPGEVRLAFPLDQHLITDEDSEEPSFPNLKADVNLHSAALPPKPPYGSETVHLVVSTNAQLLEAIIQLFPDDYLLKADAFMRAFQPVAEGWRGAKDLRTGSQSLHLHVEEVF